MPELSGAEPYNPALPPLFPLRNEHPEHPVLSPPCVLFRAENLHECVLLQAGGTACELGTYLQGFI